MKKYHLQTTFKQQGAVLVMSLLMLFVLTLIGVSSINTTSLEEKMSGNTRNRHLAFNSAESALIEAEQKIFDFAGNIKTYAQPDGSSGYYSAGNGPTIDEVLSSTWWTGGANAVQTATTATETANDAQFVIVHVKQLSAGEAASKTDLNIKSSYGKGDKQVKQVYKIFARGTGSTKNASVVIQSHYIK